MIPHHLALDYTLQPGWMAPYVDGLQEGLAMARQCAACATTSFPPHRICRCGAAAGAWITLKGDAEIAYKTAGADGQFSLAQFDGADTSAVVRLQDIAPDQTRGTLHASGTALVLGPISGASS